MTVQISEGAYFTGKYRNVFAEYGYSEDEIQAKVDQIWESLFGQDESTKIYYEAGDDMGYLLDTGNNDVRTEGMSYGMMMALQYNRQDVFDRIWKWTYTYMFMHEGKHKGYFAWSVSPEGTKNAFGPAPDGEEYFALALLFASKRWGDKAHPFDYSVKAKELLHTVIHQEEPGFPMWNPDNKLIKFIPEVEFSDPSYHLPHFYELFAELGNEADSQFWLDAAKASRDYIVKSCHPVTGLNPEYAFYDGTPNHVRGFGHFYSDSYRTVANIATDISWFNKDKRQVTIANNIQAFFADKSMDDYMRYAIDGTPLEDKSLHPVGLLATLAAGSLAADGPYAEKFVRDFWNTPPRTGDRRYYDNCLYMFAILLLSGQYRIYN